MICLKIMNMKGMGLYQICSAQNPIRQYKGMKKIRCIQKFDYVLVNQILFVERYEEKIKIYFIVFVILKDVILEECIEAMRNRYRKHYKYK